MGWAKALESGRKDAAVGRPGTGGSSPERAALSAAPPLLDQIGGVGYYAEMQRDHLQCGVLHILISAADEIAQDHHAIAQIASVERRIENAAIGHATVEHDGSDIHLAKQEVEVGGEERRQPLLAGDDEILRIDVG